MKFGLSLSFLLVSTFTAIAQDLTKSMHNAFLITRMVEKFHIQPRPLDDALSNELLSQILKAADPDKLIFSAGDIKELTAYSNILDDASYTRILLFLKLLLQPG